MYEIHKFFNALLFSADVIQPVQTRPQLQEETSVAYNKCVGVPVPWQWSSSWLGCVVKIVNERTVLCEGWKYLLLHIS